MWVWGRPIIKSILLTLSTVTFAVCIQVLYFIVISLTGICLTETDTSKKHVNTCGIEAWPFDALELSLQRNDTFSTAKGFAGHHCHCHKSVDQDCLTVRVNSHSNTCNLFKKGKKKIVVASINHPCRSTLVFSFLCSSVSETTAFLAALNTDFVINLTVAEV